MKLREMMKKIEAHNEIANIMGDDKAGLKPDDGVCRTSYQSWDALKRFINEEYIEPLAKAILQYDGFEFNKPATIHWASDWDKGDYDITPSVYIVW